MDLCVERETLAVPRRLAWHYRTSGGPALSVTRTYIAPAVVEHLCVCLCVRAGEELRCGWWLSRSLLGLFLTLALVMPDAQESTCLYVCTLYVRQIWPLNPPRRDCLEMSLCPSLRTAVVPVVQIYLVYNRADPHAKPSLKAPHEP